MKSIYLIVPFFTFSDCKNPFEKFFQPDVNICDLYEKKSVYSDSLVTIHKLTVVNSISLLSFSYAEVSDNKCSIYLFSKKPYFKYEIIDNLEARFKVISNFNCQNLSALITDDFPLRPEKLINY
jgi:hypothetical protein